VLGGAVSGCSDGSKSEQLTAEQMLDDANDTMNALKSVTIDADTEVTAGDDYSSHATTDLNTRCAARTTWATGAALEQIRIGGTDYVRPNRAYIEWSGREMAGAEEQDRWIKTLSSEAQAGDGLVECPREFASFGVATKGETTRIEGSPVIPAGGVRQGGQGGHLHLLCRHRGQAVHPQGHLQRHRLSKHHPVR
jgi:hypothetical protein